MSLLLKAVRYIVGQLMDIVYPRLCSVCQRRLMRGEECMCVSCLLDFPVSPLDLCHDEKVMKFFLPEVVPEQIIALFFYDRHSNYRHLIHQLKYGGRKEIGRYLGRMLGRNFADNLATIDAIVPIPLHKKRENKRGYNQAHQIALGISDVLGAEVLADVVCRVRNNPSQTGMNSGERSENTRDLFALSHPERITGKHLLLVDDVITTGATLASCAKILASAQDVRLSIACLGRGGL